MGRIYPLHLQPLLSRLKFFDATPALFPTSFLSLRILEVGPLLRNDGRPNFLCCFAFAMQPTGQTRFVDAYVAGCGMQSPEAIEQTAMTYSLAIAIARLLRENAWNILRDGIGFPDLLVFEL